MSNMFLSENTNLKQSGLYLGFLILQALSKDNEITIYDLFNKTKSKSKSLNYENFMNALTLLHMSGSVSFSQPYVRLEEKI